MFVGYINYLSVILYAFVCYIISLPMCLSVMLRVMCLSIIIGVFRLCYYFDSVFHGKKISVWVTVEKFQLRM